jgi:hypothetical protein
MAIRSVGIVVPLPTMTRRAQRDELLVRREHGVELVAIPAHQLRALVCNCIDRQQLKILRSSEESELALLARSGEFRKPSTGSGAITLSADWPEPPIEWNPDSSTRSLIAPTASRKAGQKCSPASQIGSMLLAPPLR